MGDSGQKTGAAGAENFTLNDFDLVNGFNNQTLINALNQPVNEELATERTKLHYYRLIAKEFIKVCKVQKLENAARKEPFYSSLKNVLDPKFFSITRLNSLQSELHSLSDIKLLCPSPGPILFDLRPIPL